MTEISGAKIAIVANDAGAANHIFAWFDSDMFKGCDINVFISGPALKVGWRLSGVVFCDSIESALEHADVLIAGTGWATDIEFLAIKQAKRKNIKAIAVIDHWVNYPNRFVRQGETVSPDEIWVTDNYALDIALREFPDSVVLVKENVYVDQQVERINLRSAATVPGIQSSVLFLMEPIRIKWNRSGVPGEIQAFRYFVDKIPSLGILGDLKVVIKPHPSDKPGKYDELVAENIEVDDQSELFELIARAGIVVGCQTYAMAIALAAGKKVFSALPPAAPPCDLPHKEIIQIRNQDVRCSK